MGRQIIIGLDGMPHGYIKDLAERGILPNFRELIKGGTFTKMESSIPHVSSVAWSSIITGKNPGEHGIFGFTDMKNGVLSFPNYNDLKAEPFWEHRKAVIINVPSTYPARQINGAMISGFVALDLKRAVYPSGLIVKLEKMGYKIDVDSSKASKSIGLFLKELDEVLKARIKAYRFLWIEDWDIFMLVFTGTDRLGHFLWGRDDIFEEHLRQIDKVVGEVMNRMDEDDLLVLLSDHGFEKSEYDVLLGSFFRKDGEALILDPGRVYVNIEEEDKGGLIKGLEEFFYDLEIDGRKVIKRVCRKEEIYSGPYMNKAPDLVLLENKGFNLKAGGDFGAKEYVESIMLGKHSQDDAFLLINKPIQLKENMKVEDVVGVINAQF